MSCKYLGGAAGALGLIISAFALTSCSEQIVATIQHDRAVVKADRAKLAADTASGDAVAISADAKALQWDQSQLAYDEGGNWEPYYERDGHGGHGGGHGRSP